VTVEPPDRDTPAVPAPTLDGPIDPELPDPNGRIADPRVLGIVALGGAMGAPLRYVLEELHPAGAGAFPLTTFLVNVSGAFALGLLVALLLGRWSRSRLLRPLVATGFLGAYTTFSTYAYETVRVGTVPRRGLAVGYAFGSVLASVLAAAVGLAITGAW
jgi:fluoride exporter